MAGAAEQTPGRVERMLIPTLGSRVRAIVKDEVGSLEKVLDARLEAVGAKIDLEKWFPTVQDMAEVKARPALVEGRISAQAGPSGKPWPHRGQAGCHGLCSAATQGVGARPLQERKAPLILKYASPAKVAVWKGRTSI